MTAAAQPNNSTHFLQKNSVHFYSISIFILFFINRTAKCSCRWRERDPCRYLSKHVPSGLESMSSGRFVSPPTRSVPDLLRHLQSWSVYASFTRILQGRPAQVDSRRGILRLQVNFAFGFVNILLPAGSIGKMFAMHSTPTKSIYSSGYCGSLVSV